MPKSSISPAPILVTGAHRSGTTWVGKMLAAGNQAAYISEPLNVWHRAGVLRIPVQNWYTYICPENEEYYLRPLHETVSFRYHLYRELGSIRSVKDFLRMLRDWSTFLRGRAYNLRPLLKDPFAVFSVPWFIERFNSQVVITVRHPAAFASSLKRLNWSFDFSNLLNQSLLVRDLLAKFEKDVNRALQNPDDIIGQSVLLWRMIYQNVADFIERYPTITIVRHEDLSLNPLSGFKSLYHTLGLEFTDGVKKAIISSSTSGNPKEVSERSVHSIRLDSRANLQNWRQRLDESEINRIMKSTRDTMAVFYPENLSEFDGSN